MQPKGAELVGQSARLSYSPARITTYTNELNPFRMRFVLAPR